MKLTPLMTMIKESHFINEITDYAEAYFVGGAVRDLQLGKRPKDVDIVVCGINESQLTDILKNYGKVELVGESFGCFKFMPFDFHVDEPIDFALARKERKTGTGHKGFEMEIDPDFTIWDDLGRRDFTINSVAINLMTGDVIDPYNGLEDLKNGIIRCVNEQAFIEDPLRIMRALQFSARFSFIIEEKTLKMMVDNKHLLSFSNKEALAGERVLEEIKKVWDKKGDLTRFINISSMFISAIFDVESFPLFECHEPNKPYIIFEDFLKILFVFSCVTYDEKKNPLKLDNKSKRAMEVIGENANLAVKIMCMENKIPGEAVNIDLELMKLYKKDLYNFDSIFFPNEIKARFDFLKENEIPMSLKELDKKTGINGETLMAKGFKGKELGNELERLLLLEMKSLD